MSAAGVPEQTSPARFRHTKGWLVFYNIAVTATEDVGERDFGEIVRRILDERQRKTKTGSWAYDVLLIYVQEGDDVLPTIVVTTNDPGSRDQNTVLSNLFAHNNPKMGGSVESFDPNGLGELLQRSVKSKSVNIDQQPVAISPVVRRYQEEEEQRESFQEAYIAGLLKDGDFEAAVGVVLASLPDLVLAQAFGGGSGRTPKSDRARAEAEVSRIATKLGIRVRKKPWWRFWA